jgi:hypothetical protein
MPTKFDDILTSFEFVSVGDGNQAFLCRRTGKVIWHSETGDLDGLEEALPDDVEEDDNYVAIPSKHHLDLGTRLVFAFAREALPGSYDEISRIFSKRGAYGRFKALLARRQALERWYDYQAKATERALRDWCADNSIDLAD